MISYEPLFKTMSQKQITSYALFKKGFSKATYYSIQQGNSISTNTVDQLCKLLDCPVSDILEYIKYVPIFVHIQFTSISVYLIVWGVCMISYKPLFQTMKEKNISSYELSKRGFSRSTYYAIKHGKSITTNTINQLCKILHCEVSDIIEYTENT